MIDTLRWIGLNRQDLPGLLADGELPATVTDVSLPLPSGHDLFIACLQGDQKNHALMVVLNEYTSRQVLAWLATYSLPSFPITQSIRTLTTDDLKDGLLSALEVRRSTLDLGLWPCIVFGELLGQGDHNTNINAVPLSRANSCFSFALARAESLYGAASQFASRCEERLKQLEDDRLFTKRAISTDELSPIWAGARQKNGDEAILTELARIISDVVRGRIAGAQLVSSPQLLEIGFDANFLAQGTIEERVRSFQAFASTIADIKNPGSASARAMLLAAAAVCVGNGTSHISLLDEVGKPNPSVYAWFGLFAAIGGSKGWDPAWNRAVNSMVRMLRSRFDITEPPIYDLSWVEYRFLREVSKPIDFVKHFPKLYPKALSVEIVPGAICQLRMNDDPIPKQAAMKSSDARDTERGQAEHRQGTISPKATSSLMEIERTLSRMQHLLRQTILDSSAPQQEGLFDSKSKKRTSYKRGIKGDDPR